MSSHTVQPLMFLLSFILLTLAPQRVFTIPASASCQQIWGQLLLNYLKPFRLPPSAAQLYVDSEMKSNAWEMYRSPQAFNSYWTLWYLLCAFNSQPELCEEVIISARPLPPASKISLLNFQFLFAYLEPYIIMTIMIPWKCFLSCSAFCFLAVHNCFLFHVFSFPSTFKLILPYDKMAYLKIVTYGQKNERMYQFIL